MHVVRICFAWQIEELEGKDRELEKLEQDWRLQEGRIQRVEAEVEDLTSKVIT